MTAVEVCPICDIAGCRHIRERKAKMTNPTDEELDAAIAGLQSMIADHGDKRTWEGAASKLGNGVAAIRTLRAQLAQVQAELVRRVDMHECAMAERDDATLYGAEQKARADKAEADLTFMTENRNKWRDSATQRWFRIEEANAQADLAEAARNAQI